MRPSNVLGPMLLIPLCSAPALAGPVPSEGPRRIAAPWEPVETVLVRWPPAHPGVVYREIDEAASLTVLVANTAQQDEAIIYCSALGIEPARLNFVTTGQVSPWPRDWGPYCVYDESGQLRIADPLWNGYPYAGPYCAEPTSTFVPNNPADATANLSVASGLGLTHLPLSFFATGGNLLTDGFGRAFSSCLLVTENLDIMPESQLRADGEAQMGITDWVILDNWESFGIQHVDCWFKFVDEETVLVKRPPGGHPEEAPTNANLALLESLTTPWGNPYTIIRIDCPPYEPNRLANYLNSYIVNDRVLVPVFGIDADEDALQVYRDAMPGYRVVGVPHDGFYNYTDAVHCRARSIHDPQMLRIAHPKIRSAQALDEPIEIRAFIDDLSSTGLIAEQTGLLWREAGLAPWQNVTLQTAPDLGEGWMRAEIPALASPTRIEYFIEASDQSGRREFMPPVGDAGPVSFEVGAEQMAVVPEQVPDRAEPQQPITLVISIDERSESLDASSVTAHVRASDSGSFSQFAMTPNADGFFEVTVPAFGCDDAPGVFFSALTDAGTVRRWPARDGGSKTIAIVEETQEVLLDAEFAGGVLPDGFVATGLWRADETCSSAFSCGGIASDPAAFNDPGSCTYDTGQRETGSLRLPPISIDAGATEATFTFCHRLHTEATDFGFLGYDIASVRINGQSVETLSDTLEPTLHAIDLLPWAGQTVEIELHFDTVDEQYNEYPGWRVQSVRIAQTVLDCVSCPADATGDGVIDLADLNLVLGHFGQNTGSGDTNADGVVDLADLNAVLASFGTGCP